MKESEGLVCIEQRDCVAIRQLYFYQDDSDFPDRLRNALDQISMRPQP